MIAYSAPLMCERWRSDKGRESAGWRSEEGLMYDSVRGAGWSGEEVLLCELPGCAIAMS